MNYKEALKVITEYPSCEDFCIKNHQLTDQYGNDNTLDLMGYWQECYNLLENIDWLKSQIIDTEYLLETVIDHSLMSISLSERLKYLKNELDSLR